MARPKTGSVFFKGVIGPVERRQKLVPMSSGREARGIKGRLLTLSRGGHSQLGRAGEIRKHFMEGKF